MICTHVASATSCPTWHLCAPHCFAQWQLTQSVDPAMHIRLTYIGFFSEAAVSCQRDASTAARTFRAIAASATWPSQKAVPRFSCTPASLVRSPSNVACSDMTTRCLAVDLQVGCCVGQCNAVMLHSGKNNLPSTSGWLHPRSTSFLVCVVQSLASRSLRNCCGT